MQKVARTPETAVYTSEHGWTWWFRLSGSDSPMGNLSQPGHGMTSDRMSCTWPVGPLIVVPAEIKAKHSNTTHVDGEKAKKECIHIIKWEQFEELVEY